MMAIFHTMVGVMLPWLKRQGSCALLVFHCSLSKANWISQRATKTNVTEQRFLGGQIFDDCLLGHVTQASQK
ncbi:hypothetical protein V9K67_21075 [Paraflavisolibacter sp. H34]